MPDTKNGYEVGYGKPPAATRYKKGQSGNPRGRPHKKPGFEDMVQRVIGEKVSITLNGRRRMVSSLEAVLHVVRTKAIGGDLKAIRLLQDLAARYQPGNREEPLSSEKDMAILENVLSRAYGQGAANSVKPGNRKCNADEA